MKNCKIILALFCACLSLATSITMLILWCCNVGGFTVVSLDSFVGIIVALLAIIVTFAIGWQIYNSIEIKEKIKKVDELKEKYNELENKIQQNHYHSQQLIFANLAELEVNKRNYTLAFRYLMASLEYTMLLDELINDEQIFVRMESITKHISNNTSCEHIEKINENDIKIKASHHYKNIKQRYEKIYNDFMSKVNNDSPQTKQGKE